MNLLFLVKSVLGLNYIITTRNVDIQQDSFLGYENFIERITIGEYNYDVIESKNLPNYLFKNPNILNIEEDSGFSIDSYNLQRYPEWYLDRIDQRSAKLNKKYYYHSKAGEGVNVFVLDTGIDVDHPEFEGRAVWGTNTIDDDYKNLHPHGTHVAGSIGSKSYGVAKKTSLIGVKVLNKNGGGTTSSVLKGIQFVVNSKLNKKVINMSLGGGRSDSLNRAVETASKMGIVVVSAAGNENQDACNTSPGSSNSAITVGAFGVGDKIAYFSNWGSCVDIFAPGVDILSTVPGGGTSKMSGTSMATPVTAGIVALLIDSSDNYTPASIKEFMKKTGTKDMLKGDLKNSPNVLVFSIPSFYFNFFYL